MISQSAMHWSGGDGGRSEMVRAANVERGTWNRRATVHFLGWTRWSHEVYSINERWCLCTVFREVRLTMATVFCSSTDARKHQVSFVRLLHFCTNWFVSGVFIHVQVGKPTRRPQLIILTQSTTLSSHPSPPVPGVWNVCGGHVVVRHVH